MKLYNNAQSPSCKRIRAMAIEIGQKIDSIELDFSKGDMQKPEYLAKNPMGKVPTFEDEGVCLWESPAILVYLAAKYPQKNLLPTDARGRAEASRWMFWNASHFEAAVMRVGYEKAVKPFLGQQPDPVKIAEGKEWFDRFAPVLNGHLEGKSWILGDAFSIADLCLGTTVEFASQLDMGLQTHRHIGAWLGRLQARDSWKKAGTAPMM